MTQLKLTHWIAAPCLVVFLNASAVIAGDNTSPVARWEFSTEEATPLRAKGNVQRDQAGPRPPEFPDMAENNTAVQLAAGAYLAVPDTGFGTVTLILRTAMPSRSKHGGESVCPSRRSGQLYRW